MTLLQITVLQKKKKKFFSSKQFRATMYLANTGAKISAVKHSIKHPLKEIV